MDCYIGIDGGGTKTLLLAADADGKLLYREKGGGSNRYSSSASSAEEVVCALIRHALAHLPESASVAGVCMGAAGTERPQDVAFFEQILRSAVPDCPVRVVNDGYASLFGVLEERPGVVISAGTGSIAWAKNDWGDNCRVGGWGHLFSDDGSGYSMVSSALRAVCRTVDGLTDEGANLMRRLMQKLDVQTPYDLIAALYNPPQQKQVASHFPDVCDLADEGDALCLRVIDEGMDALVELAAAAAAQVSLPEGFEIGMNGAVLTKVPRTRRLFREKYHARFPLCEIIDKQPDAASGALYLARRLRENEP